MAICTDCGQEMKNHVSCTKMPISFPDGTLMDQIKYYDHDEADCHDCGCPPGGYHHPGCDWERCPKCKGQLIGCGCLDEENE
jgi:hypothetical protein